MKRLFTVLFLTMLFAFTFAGCKADNEKPAPEAPPANPPEETGGETQKISEMYIYINGNRLVVKPAANAAVDALAELLKQDDITYTADDYGGFERVGNIGRSLPTSDILITAVAGDVMLYQGNQIVLFYGSNTWSYTPVGKIEGADAQLGSIIGAGTGRGQVRLSLN